MFVDIDKAKHHLNLDETFDYDNDYLIHLIASAEDAISKRLNVKSLSHLVDPNTGGLPDSVIHSILLLVGNWYQNREPVAMGTSAKIPYTFDFLADLNRSYHEPF